MAKVDKVEKKDLTTEKSAKKVVKSSYSKKKKIKKNILNGIAYVQSTFNNFFFIFIIFKFFIFDFFGFRHNYFLSGVNFFPAIAIAFPLRVLALHLVLCPLTGNFFLCLDPL